MNIPIYVISYNRLKHLTLFLERMKELDLYKHVVIVDNNSSYPPLLKYYETLDIPIMRLNQNHGHTVLWRTRLLYEDPKNYESDFYVLSDPDVIPVEECPKDIIEHLYEIYTHAPFEVAKVGLSLKIDDLPDHYKFKNEVVGWELQNWDPRKKIPIGHITGIDTTFALCKIGQLDSKIDPSIRTDFPYMARHLPWYDDSTIITEEDKFYQETKDKGVGHWSSKN